MYLRPVFALLVVAVLVSAACSSGDEATDVALTQPDSASQDQSSKLDSIEELDLEEEVLGRIDTLPRDFSTDDLAVADYAEEDLSGLDLVPDGMGQELVADVAPEDTGPLDMGPQDMGPEETDLEAQGACNNAADIDAFVTSDTETVMKDCAMSCIGKDSTCGAQCAQQKMGLSGPCSMCVGELITCTMSKCMMSCISGGPACNECISEKCGPGFSDCAGIAIP